MTALFHKSVVWFKNAYINAIRKIFDTQYTKQREMPTLGELVEDAKQDWLKAQYIYNNVSDKDLVDHAAYLIQAAEKKYMYLLKLARKEKTTYNQKYLKSG